MSVKRPKRRKLSKRVPAALVRWIKKQNPAMKRAAAVRIRKLKGGGMSITPVKANPGGYSVVKKGDVYEIRGPSGSYEGYASTRADAEAKARALGFGAKQRRKSMRGVKRHTPYPGSFY